MTLHYLHFGDTKVQIFIQCGKSDFPEKGERGGVGQMQGMENERRRDLNLNEFPRFV